MRHLILLATLLLAACATSNGLSHADNQVVNSIHEKVLENWLAMPYLDSAKRSATVNITLNPDGTVASLAIAQTSGNTNFDNGLLIAIRQSAPFKIPSSKRTETMNYELIFTK